MDVLERKYCGTLRGSESRITSSAGRRIAWNVYLDQCHYVRASVLQRVGTYECVHLCVYVSVSICSYSAMMRYVSLVSLFSVPSDPLSGAPSEPPTVTITIALASAVSKLFKILQARGSASVEFRLSSTQPQPGLYLSFANDQMMLA